MKTVILGCLIFFIALCQSEAETFPVSKVSEEIPFRVAGEPWPESFGNHRAVIKIQEDAKAIRIDLPWRRHDRDPERRKFLVVSSREGDTVAHIHRLEVNSEWCRILAGPVKAGTYFFYYLPFEVQEGYGFYRGNYLPSEDPADSGWLEELDASGVSQANVEAMECRTPLDRFHPMEIIPFDSEKTAFLAGHPGPFLLFTEDRSHPVRMRDEIPLKWIRQPQLNHFQGKAQRNEYYTFQVALYAASTDVEDLQLHFSSLQGPGESSLDSSRLTCFNTTGTNTYGRAFTKQVDVSKGRVQPLWMGVDIPPEIIPGVYRGSILMGPKQGEKQEVRVEVKITDELLRDRGDSEPWRHSRLRWLNSTAGLDQEAVAPYSPIEQKGERDYYLSGKELVIGENGLPLSIRPADHEILRRSIQLRVCGNKQDYVFSNAHFLQVTRMGGIHKEAWEQESGPLRILGEYSIEADGYMRFIIRLKSKKKIKLRDLSLEIPFRKEMAQFMMGMGLPGTAIPERHRAGWKGPEDSFWVGNTLGGLWVELRGSDYHGPLLNLYHPPPPESWDNDGRGGFRIDTREEEVLATVFSGARELQKGEEVSFEFAMLITPVKEPDPASQFRDRYYHNAASPDPDSAALAAGVKIVNLHHANRFNPFINYPFKAVDVMKPFVERNQSKGLKVKIYYTIRELTNHLPELWALWSLNGEIFGFGPGGGYPWLREHLISDYRHQWYDHGDPDRVDASLLTAPGDGRWINYYIEGLGWLIRNVEIDGLYMDDVSFDRHVMKRIRKVMEKEKPGCLIDLHSNTGFSKGPALQYAEYFPYVDKLWFGESFMYDEMPWENWLVEVSGIPFGLMGDMLHGGGNPWLGMVFGMTARLPWSTEGVTCNPTAIWKIWDEFDIQEARMVGFWEEAPVVHTSDPKVKATAYVHRDKVLISLGNFSDKSCRVRLSIDWQKLGFGPDHARLRAPSIDGFQESKNLDADALIEVEGRRGYLLYLE